MSFQSEANSTYVNGSPVAKSDVRALWGDVDDVVTTLNRLGVIPLTNIGGTANAITADMASGTPVASLNANSTVSFTPSASNTGSPVTLFVAGDQARPLRGEDGGDIPVGYLKASRFYIAQRFGANWKIISGGATFDDLAEILSDLAALGLIVGGKADLANAGKQFPTRAAAVSFGQANLPAALGAISIREGDYVAFRTPGATDDPLFETDPRWGVLLRVPSQALLDDKADQSALIAEAEERRDMVNLGGVIRLENVAGTNLITADVAADLAALGGRIVDGSQILLTPAATNTGPVEAELGDYPRAVILGMNGGALSGGELVAGRSFTLEAVDGRLVIVSGETPIARETTDQAFAVGDDRGFAGFAVSMSGAVAMAGMTVLYAESDWDWAIVDDNDFVGFGLRNGQVEFPGAAGSSGTTLDEMDARNRAFSDSVRLRVPVFQFPTAPYNIIMNYGQSLAEGNETWPSLSKTPQPGAMMIGSNVDNQQQETYTVIGSFDWQPLVAQTAVGGVNLDGAGEAALSPGDQAKGEPPVIGLTNGLKYHLNRRSMAEDNGRNLVAMSSAQQGKTIGQLSKVNPEDSHDRYGGVIDGIAKAVTLADGDACCVPVIPFCQGEYDYVDNFGSTNGTRALYRTAMNALFDDFAADIPAITGQSQPPLFITYQTTGSWSRDVDLDGAPGLHVGMAQLDVALARDDTVMFGPAYPYTDKGVHLDANGSRWMGHQMAKVAARALAGEGWQPLRPIEVQAVGSSVYVHFHVPVPPLRIADPYVGSVATDYPAKGFKVTSADGTTVYAVTGVEVVRSTIVRIDCATPPPPDALVWYADKAAHNGNGCLADSDPTLALDRYEYVPERGMYPSANIPALVGQRYPLHNWSVAFCLPVTYSEF